MDNTLDIMDLKQIITLHLDGLSKRKIGELIGINRNAVNDYMKLFKASDFGFSEFLNMDNTRIKELFTSHTTINNDRFGQLMLHFDKIYHSRNHAGFTFQYHYNSNYDLDLADLLPHNWKKSNPCQSFSENSN